MTIESMIREVQAKLGITVDGIAGPNTWGAIYRKICLQSGDLVPAPSDISAVDERSEKNIQTLLPEVRPYARALVNSAMQHGIIIKVTSGTRSFQEQAELRRRWEAREPGAGKAAAPGYSNHQFGVAFDITVFQEDNKTPIWDGRQYDIVGSLGKSLGLTWGGDWTGADDDPPHFSLRPAWAKGLTETQFVTGLRDRHSQNKPVFS